MAILKIAKMGHPVLRRPADPIPDPTAPEIARLIADMRETMVDAGGVGLAAPQVHVPLRLVIFSVPAGRTADGAEVAETVLVNPEITVLTDEIATAFEGCLSLPGMTGAVPRPTHIRYRGLGPDGGVIDREARGFHARVVLHECDHLDGVLYPQRMTDMASFGYVEAMRSPFPPQPAAGAAAPANPEGP